MSKSKIQSLMMMYAMMGMMGPDIMGVKDTYKEELTPEDLIKIEKIREQKAKERQLNKGLKEFTIDNITVIALNYNNALKKVNKIKDLICL